MDKIEKSKNVDFESLVKHIQHASEALRQDARLVINRNVTTRAWLTGFYIVEYEQHGNDRAKYGDKLLKRLAERLDDKSWSQTSLKNARAFYLTFPEISHTVISYLVQHFGKSQALPDLLQLPDSQMLEKSQSLPDFFEPVPAAAEVSKDGFAMLTVNGDVMPVPQMVFDRLSYTHIAILAYINDPLKRAFYAIEAMRGPWSYRELQRQIDSNYYERSGWSKKPELLSKKVNDKAEKPTFREELKSHYVFEFLGLAAKNVIEEDALEQSLIDHFEEFMLELGMGFCLEARQKKLLIDDRYFKADLVFYHRILKMHCIVELKGHRLDYADMAQLNMYLEYYRRHYMQPDDNPPVGLLLCTEYGQEMVEYVTPNMDPNLFVAQYELQLPSKEKMKEFLMKENRG
jgi:predicted nuclease of restriction endonuclease-like (RecB) superfamily